MLADGDKKNEENNADNNKTRLMVVGDKNKNSWIKTTKEKNANDNETSMVGGNNNNGEHDADNAEEEVDALFTKKNLYTILHVGLNSFLIYFAIYGFRKPWGAARFEGQRAVGMKLKDAFSMFQTLGYALGKVAGTFLVPLIPSDKTTNVLALLPVVSLFFWFGFALAGNNPGWMVFFMFFSAMPLSFGWSLLYRKIEGRRTGDVLGAILNASFISASGFSKDVGRFLLSSNISEPWMPFIACLCFILPIEIFIYFIKYIPTPTLKEVKVYSKRTKMPLKQQKFFFSKFWPGLILYFFAYFLVTALRDYRDDFGVEIWSERTGGDKMPSFTSTETFVAIAVVVASSCIFTIRSTRNAMLAYYVMTLVGMVLLLVAQLLDLESHIWFVLTGIGLFFGYTPVSALFDRLLGALKFGNSTASLLINAADATGYIGTVVLLLYKNFHEDQIEVGYYDYFKFMTDIVAIVSFACFLVSAIYFSRKVFVGSELEEDFSSLL